MIVGIITVNKNKYISGISKQFVRKLTNEGHIVKEVNSMLEEVRLTGYNYLIFFVGNTSLEDKHVLHSLEGYLKISGNLSNKYASLFIEKKFCGNRRRLMKFSDILEENGLSIHFTEIVKNNTQMATILTQLSPIKFGK